MQFDPSNPVVKICLQAMGTDEKGAAEDADKLFLQAWNTATQDFEKFISAYFLARRQKKPSEKLKWFETSLQLGLKINDDSVKSAFPFIYGNLAQCYEELGEKGKAKSCRDLSTSFNDAPSDRGPFYHGTRAELNVGDLLVAGGNSNYKENFMMNHIYFTALPNGAGLAASLAKGDKEERVYIVEPTGVFENDPNVTDKKFPGNPSRSYRSASPLKIVGELKEFPRLTAEELKKWRERLAASNGEIIN